jgi:2'-5' RNA ligase
MRLFVAIDIPDAVRAALESFQAKLRPTAKLNWSPVANLHITTKFIGEWPEDRIADMTLALAAVRVAGPIEIRVKGIGWFPNERRPRVFWAGVDGGEPLRVLARATEQAAAAAGVPTEERSFSPHLTLARIREAVPLEALQAKLQSITEGGEIDFGAFRASHFVLYLSRGGKYTRLTEFPLE